MRKVLKKAALFWLAAIMICCAATFAACNNDNDNSGETVTEKYTIEGVVASELGPISGVTVKLGNETKTTGSAGSYSFEVSAGEYTLTFTKTGYIDVQKSVKTDDAVNGTVKLNVSMTVQEKEYFVISGTVSDADGAIANATVSGSALSETVTADANGAFTLPQLEKKGSYTFTFAASGYVSADKTVNASDVSGSAHTLNVTLEKIPAEQLATVSGVVTADYPEGNLAGVTVKIGTTEVKTDANGAYSVQTSRDACTVEFSKDGYATVSESVSAEDVADGAHTLNAEMTRNTVLAGKTNAELVGEYSSMNDIAVSGQLKDQIHAVSPWKEGGADGSAAGILSEGYQMESKQDNANDDYRRYIYGKMTVSADNKIVTLYGRTFSGVATECAVKVIIPGTLESALIKEKTQKTEWATLNSGTYGSLTFDLSEYVGENIILAVGVRKAAITVERIVFGSGEFVFGRTTQAEFENVKTLDLTQGTSFEGNAVRSAFDINGNIEGKNTDNDYAAKSARFYACYVGQNTAEDADLFMYAYAKVNITAANARMSVQWYRDRAPKLRVEAYDVATKELIKAYDSLYNGSEEKTTQTAQIDLADCIGKTVVLAIGMTSGERLDLQKISFARYSYTLKGTVTLPAEGEYDLSKVSFKLNDDPLTSEGGFTYTAASGTYELALTVDAIGTLTVSYDNTGITDDTKKLLAATYTLSSAVTQDEVTQDFTLQQDSNVPQPISIILNAETALTDGAAAIKLGDHDFTYANGKWSLDGLTMAKAVELGNVTVTLKGKYANIYADPSFTLTTSDYENGSAEKEITLEEKDILPGLTFSQLQATEIKEVPVISSSGKTAIGNLWNEGGATGSECDVIGEGYRMTSKIDNANDEYRRYIYGKLNVTENNDTLTLYGRTFGTETEFAVKVIDFTTFEGTFIQATGSSTVWQKYNGSDYGKYAYDLSGFDSKTVIVAIGVRKAALTVESILLSADGTFAFGRTSAAALRDLQAVNIATGTKFSAGSDPKIQETFVTVGAAKVDNNRWMLSDARGDNTDDAQPYSYVYCKTDITSANARMSIRWSSYGNGTMALTKVLAVNAQDNSVIRLYSGNNSVDGEWCESRFDLTECVGKEVILAIGMSYGNRMGIDWIRFDRMSYILTGAVTLPQDGEYDLSKVSFKLNDDPLTSGNGGFTYNNGTYELALTVDATGTLTVSYDNSDITDDTKKLLDATYILSGAVTQDEITQNFRLQQNSAAPQPISITLNADTALTGDDAEIKLGTHEFTYANGKWTLDTLSMADAVALGNVTVTLKGKYANIYADPSFTLNTGDYSGGSAEKEITLEEKDILPGLTFSQMQNAKTLDYDYYQGYRAHNILRSFAKSSPLRSEEQTEGDTIRVIQNSAKSATEFNGYIYGVRTIREATKTMTVNMRTHDTSNDTIFGVMVVDLESGARALIGGLRTSRQNSYNDVTFDLTEYVGKRVLIATGIFYTEACTRWDVQYVIHHIRFYDLGSDWGSTVDTLAGNLLHNTDVAGQSTNDFVGSANDKDKSNYIFAMWGTASKNFESADYEMDASQGALIKTRNDEQNVENCVFLYSKFAITAQNSYLRFKARGFGGKIPELAVTVYSLGTNGEVVEKIITPDISAFDLNGNKVTDMGGGWINGSWSTDDYTQFKWDLSEFEGQKVVVLIGLRNTQGGENKIAIQEIHLEAKPQENN